MSAKKIQLNQSSSCSRATRLPSSVASAKPAPTAAAATSSAPAKVMRSALLHLAALPLSIIAIAWRVHSAEGIVEVVAAATLGNGTRRQLMFRLIDRWRGWQRLRR